MKIKKIVFLTLFIINSLTYAQSYKYARYCAKNLASKEFYGRGYMNNGDKIAADFIISELQTSGFSNTNFNQNNSSSIEVQKLPVKINNIEKLSLKLHNEDTLRVEGKDYLVHGSSAKSYLKLKNAKCLIFKDKAQFEKFNSKKIDDNILIFNQKTISSRDISLIIRNLAKSDYFPKLIIIQGYEKIMYPIATYTVKFPILLLKGEEFKKNKIDYLELDIDSKFIPQYETQNIWARIEGTRCKDSTIVFVSHYDHLGMCGNAVFQGASDNASGVSVNLDLAKYYAKNPQPYSIVFIFTIGEEIGLVGSSYAAEYPLIDLSKTKFLMNFDMPSTGSWSFNIVNATEIPDKAQIFVDINDEVQAFNDIVLGGTSCNSDHCPFIQKGVPGFFILTHGIENMEYHTIYDTPDVLTFTKHVDFCNYIKEFVRRIQ